MEQQIIETNCVAAKDADKGAKPRFNISEKLPGFGVGEVFYKALNPIRIETGFLAWESEVTHAYRR